MSYDSILDTMSNELEYVRCTIRDFLKSGDQLLAVTITLLATGFAILKANDSRLVEVGIPWLLAAPGMYVLRVNALIQHLGGYRQALEESIGELIGARVLLWESSVAPVLKKSLSASLHTFALAALWLATVIYSTVAIALHDYYWPVAVCIYASYMVLAVLMGLSLRWGMRLYRRAYDAATPELKAAVQGVSPPVVPAANP